MNLLTFDAAIVIVAHPDDETLGCGGTIARLADAGVSVTVGTFTDGVSARLGATAEDYRQRDVAIQRACACLGARYEPIAQSVPDNEADTISRLRLARLIESWASTHQGSSVVFTHSRADLNIDHRRVHEAVLTAFRPQPGSRVRAILGCEIASSTEWGVRPFVPQCRVDISHTIHRKLDALACYDAELRPSPHPRSREMVLARAHTRGSEAGYFAAEAFEMLRMRV